MVLSVTSNRRPKATLIDEHSDAVPLLLFFSTAVLGVNATHNVAVSSKRGRAGKKGALLV